MAGRENQGYLRVWDLALGLQVDLQLSIVGAGFRTLSLPLCKILGAEMQV